MNKKTRYLIKIQWNSVITNIYLGQMCHFNTQINPVITNKNGWSRVSLYLQNCQKRSVIKWHWFDFLHLFFQPFWCSVRLKKNFQRQFWVSCKIYNNLIRLHLYNANQHFSTLLTLSFLSFLSLTHTDKKHTLKLCF